MIGGNGNPTSARQRVRRALVWLAVVSCSQPGLAQLNQRQVSVGVSGHIEQLVLPGPQLSVRPIDSDAPLVVRIVQTYPHGTDFRYDIEYYGLEPGTYNLMDALQQADGTAAVGPPVEVTIQAVLPPGQILPHAPEAVGLPGLGGYHMWMTLLAVVWVGGLVAILFWRRGGKARAVESSQRPLTLAERLRPLLEQAMSGELPQARHAQLEMTLVAWWRRRLDVDGLPAEEALAHLREHEEAGPLLLQLESWLHQPPDRRAQTDLATLLRPYESLPGSVLDEADVRRSDEAVS